LKQEIDIVHFLVPRQYPFYFKFPANKFISTYHAGGDITAPVDTFVFSRFVYNIVGKYQNRYLTKIVADSEIAKIEIENAYSIQGARVDVIHLGSDHLWELPDIGRLESDNYILIVGRWQKYKNVHKILDAISSNEFFYKDYYKIILIGSNETDGRDLVLNEINKFSIEQIKCLTFVTEEELKSYYKYASLVIHPSINEGFGWPAFEAFGEGAPLLIHDQTPAGNLLKNNLGVTSCNLLGTTDSIHNSIQKALKINLIDLNERRKIIINMDCTWDKMVQNYYQLYLKVLRA
jgi:glycosyltransferase involved in cell wall biosynthesis